MQEVRKRVGDRARVTVEYAESLPRTANGKLRFVVSDVGANR